MGLRLVVILSLRILADRDMGDFFLALLTKIPYYYRRKKRRKRLRNFGIVLRQYKKRKFCSFGRTRSTVGMEYLIIDDSMRMHDGILTSFCSSLFIGGIYT